MTTRLRQGRRMFRGLLQRSVCGLLCCVGTAFSQYDGPESHPSATVTDGSLEGARTLISQSRFKEAEVTLREVIATHPNDADAQYLLGYSLLRQNEPKESLVTFNRAAKLRTPTSEDLVHVAQ